jgi:hypothetical protein
MAPSLLTDYLRNDVEVAEYFGVKVATVRKWRVLGQGPRWIKIGHCVRYRPEGLLAFLNSCPVKGSGQPAANGK